MGQSTPSEANAHTFGMVAEDFLHQQQLRLTPGTSSRLSRLIPTLIRYFGESTPIDSISQRNIECFLADCGQLLASSSLVLRLKILKQIFAFALNRGLIDRDPARNLKPPAVKEPENRFLTHEEFSRVLQACPEWLKPIVELSVATGLRRGEIVKLKWNDIDEQVGAIRVRPSSGSEGRVIPLNKLARHSVASLKLKRVEVSDYVFSRALLRSDKISVAFMRACRSVGIDGVSFRHLRNTAAVWMANHGMNIETISQFLGTKSSVSAARYLRSPESQLGDAITAIDKAVAAGASDFGRRRTKKGP